MSAKRAILIVDDEAILLLSLRQELRLKFGPEILYETALSGELGLKAVGRLDEAGVRLVLVISDWLMPGMRGDEFLRTVHARYPNVHLLMLSGHADANKMQNLILEPKIYSFLHKPYASSALYELVDKALAG